ncbi:hypothetical protein BCR33DRAFT_763156 [Rhizoclosmatium globosum]|uniref:J domain-containing protein n=1 Tax=Rhizoclosmatium globosum TaxID=329046 RepID=A0A1Y2CQN6_9FUNG|nr:hypothetical protein BCR33DRAFT_763156 [Rhizoclosmatium globosum]|eukprot:ORY49341.1 hypothetical protein BCR33DRAFT_763156 [Rhizoclosmatium globosum]
MSTSAEDLPAALAAFLAQKALEKDASGPSIRDRLSQKPDQIWSASKQSWVYYSLPDEVQQVLQGDSADHELVFVFTPKPIKDETLYRLLGVPATASKADIKKAYRAKALALHPDKNPSPKLRRILIDDDKREQYDLKGDDSIKDFKPDFNNADVFDFVFGSTYFEKYIGELFTIDNSTLSKSKTDSDLTPAEKLERLHRQEWYRLAKEVRLAVKLADILDRYVNDKTEDHDEFYDFCNQELMLLAESEYGKNMCGLVGYVYEERGNNYLGFKIGGVGVTTLTRTAHFAANVTRASGSLLNTIAVARRLSKISDDAEKLAIEDSISTKDKPDTISEEGSELEFEKDFVEVRADKRASARWSLRLTGGRERSLLNLAPEELDPLLEAGVNTLWHSSLIQHESTLRSVCFKVLHDTSVSKEIRAKRAEGLVMMGKMFQLPQHKVSDGLAEITEKLKALVRTYGAVDSKKAEE